MWPRPLIAADVALLFCCVASLATAQSPTPTVTPLPVVPPQIFYNSPTPTPPFATLTPSSTRTMTATRTATRTRTRTPTVTATVTPAATHTVGIVRRFRFFDHRAPQFRFSLR